MKKLALIISLLFMSTSIAEAVCKGSIINPITDVRWKCMFPISLGGVSAAEIPFPEAKDAIISDKALSGAISPVCTCMDPLPRVGITFSMNNVFRIVETVKDPLCFPTLGMQIGSGPFGRAGADGGRRDLSKTTFNYTHMISFVPTQALNLFIDSLCVQASEAYSPLSVLNISEFDPTAKSSEMSLIIFPESVLFANPVAQAYCMVDSALTVFEMTDPIGFWCVGGHSVFPMSNHSVEAAEYVDAAAINASKYLFKMSRTGMLLSCFGSQALCSCVPTFIWNKQEFRLQLAKPLSSTFCFRLGKASLLWNVPNRNPVLVEGADNLVFMVWRRRDCCAF